MDTKSIRRVKSACYAVNVSMAITANVPPLLFLTFRSLYGISYSLLGTLVLINFVTQLTVDIIFSFFSHKFNIVKTVKFTPLICTVGLVFYAVMPYIFPETSFLWLVFGTVIFSASAGLAEVLISPTVAALPSDNPEREMSRLHSIYAWGAVAAVIVSTLFIRAFGAENWPWLIIGLSIIPFLAFLLFYFSELPVMETPEKASVAFSFLKNKTLWLCIIAIFLGGASECIMAQWSSSYLEEALEIPKVLGDVFGVALFAAALGTGRTLYAEKGKNITDVLLFGAIGASVCYFTAAVTDSAIIGLLACAFTGFCVSMLWPGSLIVSSDCFKNGGVFIYAVMAAGGDLGGSVGPQLIGMITDAALKSNTLKNLAMNFNILPEQFGMKLGMLVGMIFPLTAIIVFKKLKNKHEALQT